MTNPVRTLLTALFVLCATISASAIPHAPLHAAPEIASVRSERPAKPEPVLNCDDACFSVRAACVDDLVKTCGGRKERPLACHDAALVKCERNDAYQACLKKCQQGG